MLQEDQEDERGECSFHVADAEALTDREYNLFLDSSGETLAAWRNVKLIYRYGDSFSNFKSGTKRSAYVSFKIKLSD